MRGMTEDLTAGTTQVRQLRPDEFRTASTLFRASLHHMAATDEAWAVRGRSYEEGRVFGAFRGDTLVGSALSMGSQLAVPGGALLPMAMVTAVGVRADHTRQGVLTSLMRAQLTGMSEPIATLRASEAVIYGRFGYGVASRGRMLTVDRRRAVVRPEVPQAGSVRLVPVQDAQDVLPGLYDAVSVQRPGWAARSDSWWSEVRMWSMESKELTWAAIHTGPDGDDGFAIYNVTRTRDAEPKSVLNVEDLWGATDEVWASLWRFLLTVDLVDEIRADYRPLDEQVERLFVDRRRVRTTWLEDETWLRLADVPAALAARSFGELATGTGSVVIDVRDPFLPANSGRYLIGDGPARSVDETAELALDVDTLAELYLGDVFPSQLASVGRITVAKTEALARADRLFAIAGSPWCGTFF
jgi:predicted acetyltransferase